MAKFLSILFSIGFTFDFDNDDKKYDSAYSSLAHLSKEGIHGLFFFTGDKAVKNFLTEGSLFIN